MSKPLENKLALVTGSSRGIGAAIAIRLAAEGASVIVNYAASPARAEKIVKEIRDAGGKAEAVGADLSTIEGTNKLIASIDQAFGGSFGGRLDILVNNAGSVVFGPFMEGAEDSYDKHFNLNVRSVIALSKDSARRMIPQKWGADYQHRFLLRRGCTSSRRDDVYRNQICRPRLHTRTLARAGGYRNYGQWRAAWPY
jgi:3-oxoacyl-[acyl-carrier protein] reductase